MTAKGSPAGPLPDPQPHPDEVHPTRRRLELTLVSVTAVAALVAAGLSAWSAWLVQSQQVRAEERRELVQIYAAYILAAETYLLTIRRLPLCSPDGALAGRSAINRFREDSRSYDEAALRVFLVGSPEAENEEGTLSASLRDIERIISVGKARGSRGDSICLGADEIHSRAVLEIVEDGIMDFRALARAELTR